MRKLLTLAGVLALTTTGCWKTEKEPDYTITADVTRRSAPPPIMINPTGTNADGVTGFQLAANDFITSTDKDALVRSCVAYITAERDKTGNKAVRIGNGKQATDQEEVKKLEKSLTELGFSVTVVAKAAEGTEAQAITKAKE